MIFYLLLEPEFWYGVLIALAREWAPLLFIVLVLAIVVITFTAMTARRIKKR